MSFLSMVTAWLAVKAYRMVPARVRGLYPGFPVSTSHLFRWGMGWKEIRQFTGDSKVPRVPMPHE